MDKINQLMEQARVCYRRQDLLGLRDIRDLVSAEYSKLELEAITKGFDEVTRIYELEQESTLELDTMITKTEIKEQMARR